MKYLTLLPLFIFLLIPESISAQGFLTCVGDDCNYCTLIQTVNSVTDWVLVVSILIAVILLMYQGFRIAGSRGDVSAFAQARSSFANIVIGIFIIMAAGTIIDTLMKSVAGGQFGLWNQPTSCGGAFEAGSATDIDIELHEHEASEALTDNPYGEGGVYALEGPEAGTTAPPSGTADGSFTYQSGISAQRGHASPALSSMLNCMAQRVPGNVGQISSISDSRIVNGSQTFQSCVSGGCAHVRNSRHYGGATCTGSSYAVDFGDEQNVGVICQAANACGSVSSCSVHNGNHVHLSLPLSC
ncbi:MAG: hypothetical protein ACI9H6_000123 [Patiriisocius sp.]|jgi:hypothetical protein